MGRINPPIQPTTCQICGRPIKANTGVIAHHGYQRPGWGSQTSSCHGARYLPYEQSNDRIPYVIDLIKTHLERTEAALKDLIANPPDTLTEYDHRFKPHTAERPANFDPLGRRHSYHPYAYESIYFGRIDEWEREIPSMRRDIETLQQRFDNWRPTFDYKPQPSDTEWCAYEPYEANSNHASAYYMAFTNMDALYYSRSHGEWMHHATDGSFRSFPMFAARTDGGERA